MAAQYPPRNFWFKQVSILTVTALVLYIAFYYWPIDNWAIAPYADLSTQSFPLRDAWITDDFAHDLIKKVLFLIAAVLLSGVGLSFWCPSFKSWRIPSGFVLLGMALGPSVVGILKSFSHHSCPWDIAFYTGSKGSGGTEYRLFEVMPLNPGRGKCFPGGHSAGGFGTMAFYFIAYAAGYKKAWLYALAGFILGFGMGYTQMMRGAHFLSHNLWAAWIVWVVLVALFYIYTMIGGISLQRLAAPKNMLSGFKMQNTAHFIQSSKY